MRSHHTRTGARVFISTVQHNHKLKSNEVQCKMLHWHCCLLLLCTVHCTTAPVQTAQHPGVTRVLYNHDTVPARTLLLHHTWCRIMPVPACYVQVLARAALCTMQVQHRVRIARASHHGKIRVPLCCAWVALQHAARLATAPQPKPVSKIKHCVPLSYRHNAGTSADKGIGSLPGRRRGKDGVATSIPTWLI
jgi:hypothetical protein